VGPRDNCCSCGCIPSSCCCHSCNASSCCHSCNRFVDILGKEPLFVEDISGAMLSISIVFPPESCNANLFFWYMLGGLSTLLVSLMDRFIQSVTDMAKAWW
jgi:hypothetical protein